MRWLNKVIYKAGQGGSELYFTDEVLLLLREFDALNPYTKYKKEVVLRLKRLFPRLLPPSQKASNNGRFSN